MRFTTLSSREFNQDTSRAREAALEGPVFITDCGTPGHVLLSIEAYRRLVVAQDSIFGIVGLPFGVGDTEIDISRRA